MRYNIIMINPILILKAKLFLHKLLFLNTKLKTFLYGVFCVLVEMESVEIKHEAMITKC